jgi:uncharacterized membrane protein
VFGAFFGFWLTCGLFIVGVICFFFQFGFLIISGSFSFVFSFLRGTQAIEQAVLIEQEPASEMIEIIDTVKVMTTS